MLDVGAVPGLVERVSARVSTCSSTEEAQGCCGGGDCTAACGCNHPEAVRNGCVQCQFIFASAGFATDLYDDEVNGSWISIGGGVAATERQVISGLVRIQEGAFKRSCHTWSSYLQSQFHGLR